MLAFVALIAFAAHANAVFTSDIFTSYCDGSYEFGHFAFAPILYQWTGFVKASNLMYDKSLKAAQCGCDGLSEEEFVRHFQLRSPEFLLNLMGGPRDGKFTIDSCDFDATGDVFFVNNTDVTIEVAPTFTADFYSQNGYVAFKTKLKGVDLAIGVVLAGCSSAKGMSFVQLKCIGEACKNFGAACVEHTECGADSDGLKCVHLTRTDPDCSECVVEGNHWLNVDCNPAEESSLCDSGEHGALFTLDETNSCVIDELPDDHRRFPVGFPYWNETDSGCMKYTCLIPTGDMTPVWDEDNEWDQSKCSFGSDSAWESAWPYNEWNTINHRTLREAGFWTSPDDSNTGSTQSNSNSDANNAGASASASASASNEGAEEDEGGNPFGDIELGADNTYTSLADYEDKEDVPTEPIVVGDRWWTSEMADTFNSIMNTPTSEAAEVVEQCPTLGSPQAFISRLRNFVRKLHYRALDLPEPSDSELDPVIGVCAPHQLLGENEDAQSKPGFEFMVPSTLSDPLTALNKFLDIGCSAEQVSWDCDGDGVAGGGPEKRDQHDSPSSSGATSGSNAQQSSSGEDSAQGGHGDGSCDGYVIASCTSADSRKWQSGVGAASEGFPSLSAAAKRDDGQSPIPEVAAPATGGAKAVVLIHTTCDGAFSFHPNSDWFGFRAALPRLADMIDFVRDEHRAYQNCRAQNADMQDLTDAQYEARFPNFGWLLYWLTPADAIDLGPDFNDFRLRSVDAMNDVRIQLPASCSYTKWRETEACTIQYTGLGDLFGVEAQMRFYYTMNRDRCPNQDILGEVYLDCLGKGCHLLDKPVPCPSGNECDEYTNDADTLIACRALEDIVKDEEEDGSNDANDQSTQNGSIEPNKRQDPPNQDSQGQSGEGQGGAVLVDEERYDVVEAESNSAVAALFPLAVFAPGATAIFASSSSTEQANCPKEDPVKLVSEILYGIAGVPYNDKDSFCFVKDTFGEKASAFFQASVMADETMVTVEGFEEWIEPMDLEPAMTSGGIGPGTTNSGSTRGGATEQSASSTIAVAVGLVVAVLVAALV